jgi:autotransporter-associated beta strand protein
LAKSVKILLYNYSSKPNQKKYMKTQNLICRFCGWLFTATGLMLMTATTVHADYQSTVLADNPLAYYALNPAADGTSTAPDLSGNGNDGIAAGITATSGPSSYITNAANFNGGAAIDLSYGSNPGLLNFNGPITLEAWCQPSSSALFGDILARGYDSSNYDEIVIRANGPYGANYYGSSGSANVTGGTQTTNWTYVVLSSDGTNCSLYENGLLVAQSADTSGSTTNFPAGDDDWLIGNGSSAGSTRLWNGKISEVAIYNHGLTAAQVLNHYYIGEINSPASNSVPLIVTQPQPQQSYVGGSATFSVTAVSASPMTNQWFKGATPLTGQTNSTLTFTNLQSTNAGNYSVVVGNIKGTTNSISVSLSVSTPSSLKWSSVNNSGVWDTGLSTNWVNVSNSQAVVFNPGDSVLFDDTAGVPTTVTVSNTVVPSLTTVNSTNNVFTISGPGTISGSGSLVKQGSSLLTITSAGNFTGPVSISGGAIYAGNNSLDSVASITITNNSTLDFGGGQIPGSKPVTVSGTGLNGEGALYNSYDNYPSESLNITLAGDTKFGGANRWDLASGSQISGAHNLTLDLSSDADSHYAQWNSVTIGANVASIVVTNTSPGSVTNALGMTGMDAAFQNPGTVLTLCTNCQLVFYGGGINGSIHLLGGAQIYHYTAPAGFNGSSMVFENGSALISYYNSGATTPVNSAITLNGVAHFVIGDHNMVYTNVISGSGGFVEDYYNSQMVFSASNTYTGPTIIGSSGNSPEVALTGNGSISHSSLIFFGGSDPTVAHLDVIGRPDQTLTLASGQTLGGIGDINGSLVVSSGATISPAGTNTTIGITTGSNATGTIMASGTVTLNGTTVLKLDGSGVNDEVKAGGAITYGGTLNLENISGSPYAAGNSFQIFSGTGYSGSFNIVPATPGAGLAWDTSQLNTLGFLNVMSASATHPVISSTAVSGGNLIFSGTGGSANGTYYVLTTTSLTNALSNWTVLSTNTFDASGNFSVTNTINSGTPQRFYSIYYAP